MLSKKHLVLLAACALPLSASAAVDGWYFGATGGISITPSLSAGGTAAGRTLNYSSKSFLASLNGGYKSGPMRYEAEVNGMRSSYRKFLAINVGGATQVVAVMANVYYDFDQLSDNFIPYLGVGIGYANLRNPITLGVPTAPKTNFTSNTDNEFAYQGKIGLQYVVNESVSVGGQYRYFATSKVNGLANEMFQNHSIEATLTYYVG